MKLYWTQGGLHAEPEDSREREALMALWQSAIRAGFRKEERVKNAAGSTASSANATIHGLNSLVVH
jgi:hypothetical protein